MSKIQNFILYIPAQDKYCNQTVSCMNFILKSMSDVIKKSKPFHKNTKEVGNNNFNTNNRTSYIGIAQTTFDVVIISEVIILSITSFVR